jgi:hypothetical protein
MPSAWPEDDKGRMAALGDFGTRLADEMDKLAPRLTLTDFNSRHAAS